MHWTDELFDGPYDREYEGKTAEDIERATGEAEFIVNELDLKGTDRVLDLACGHGRHAITVAEYVDEVIGVDQTKRYLEYAEKYVTDKGISNVRYFQGDMRELSFDAEFDAAYNYFTAWGYWDDDTNQDILNRVCRALKPEGRFLMESIHRDSIVRRFEQRGWYQLDDSNYVLEDREFDCITGHSRSNRIYINTSANDPDIPPVREIEICVRVPSASEFIRMFTDAGFTDIRILEAPTGEQLTIESRRIAVIGHAKA